MFLTILLSIALAAEFPPAEPERAPAVVYNDEIVSIEHEAVAGFQVLLQEQAASGTPESQTRFLVEYRALIEQSLVRTAAIPDFEGDGRMREAYLEAWRRLLRICDGPIAEIYELSRAERVRNADLVRLEELLRQVDAECEEMGRRLQAAQIDFAADHGITLLPPDETVQLELPREDFHVPGLVPEGSKLKGQHITGYALRYHNQLIVHQIQLGELHAGFMEVINSEDLKTLEKARKATLKELKGVRQALAGEEDWQGDAGLRDGLLAMNDGLVELYEGPIRDFIAERSAKDALRTQESADLINELARQVNEGSAAAFQPYEVARAAFASAWHFEAYHAWSERERDKARQAVEQAPPQTTSSQQASEEER